MYAEVMSTLALSCSVATLFRAVAKDQREIKLQPLRQEFEARANGPINAALEEIEDANMNFALTVGTLTGRGAEMDHIERSNVIGGYQKETFLPAKTKLDRALLRADKCRIRMRAAKMSEYSDPLENLLDLMATLSTEQSPTERQYERAVRQFGECTMEVDLKLKELLQNVADDIEDSVSLRFLGLFAKVKTIPASLK